MKTAIAAILIVAAFSGCENSGPSASSLLRYQVDAERERSVWLTRDGVQIHSAAAWPVKVELPGWSYAGAPYCPPSLAVGPNGEVVVTSNVVPTVWRIDATTLAVSTHELTLSADQDKDVGFAALVYAPEQGVYVAYSETQRSVWKIDPALSRAVKVAAVDFDRSRAARARHAGCADLARRLTQPAID